jgi:tRNA (adenine57-N1/adenine58-N1)-methyltransferase catalytic subunit
MDLIAFHSSGKRIIIKSKSVANNNEFGQITREAMEKAQNGDVIETSKGEKFTIVYPSFIDQYNNMKRGAQSIKLKDCCAILSETLIGKDSICLDCGAGMGGLTCFLARYSKKVYSLDNRQEHLDTAKKNADLLKLDNIDFILHDITESIPEVEKLDLITLDIIDPEKVIIHAKTALKTGGFIVAYCPQASQMQLFGNTLVENGYELTNAIEVNSRFWKIEGRIVRPEHMGLQHTGFLVFGRKIF